MDKKKICNYGRARYFGGNTPQMKITDEFYRAVKRLPVQYNEGAYFAFIENWGTVSSEASSYTVGRGCVVVVMKQP